MLEVKPIDYTNQVITMKLVAAQHQILELIGLCVYIDANIIRLKNPQMLVPVPTKNGQQDVGMVNMFLTGGNEITELTRSVVMGLTLTGAEFKAEYEKTNSLLITPPTSLTL